MKPNPGPRNEEQAVCIPLEWEGLRGEYRLRDLWLREDLGSVTGDFCRTLSPHGSVLFLLSE
jgi:hypothetical protein